MLSTLKKQTKRATKKRTKKHVSRSGSKPRSSTKPTHVYLNSWGFIRVPSEYIQKLPFGRNEDLDLVIKGKTLIITKKLSSSPSLKKLETKINKALSGEIKAETSKDFKKCPKHKVEYTDFCPMCKALEVADNNEKKSKVKEMVPA